MKETVMLEFLNPENWKPHFSKISRNTNTAVSIVFDNYKKLMQDGKLQIKIKELTTEEAVKRRENAKNTD